jgi:hypothetical protein
MTKSILGSSLIWQGIYLNLFGPMHCKGEHLFENTGSIIIFTLPPIPITAVECPIQVYLILLLGHLNSGFLLIGNLLSKSSKSSGTPLFSNFVLHLRKAPIAAQKPLVMKLSLISSNLGSNFDEKQPR